METFRASFTIKAALLCSSIHQKSQPVVRRRSHMPPLPDLSNTQAHLGGLQDQFHSRSLHLAAQSGVAVSCSSAGRSTGERVRPPSFLIPSRLDSKGPTSGSRLQRVCSLIYSEDPTGDGSERKGPFAGSTRPLQGCGIGKSVAVDGKKGRHLGP